MPEKLAPDRTRATPPVSRPAQVARDLGLVITNLTKLGGAAIAFNEALLRPELRPIAMATAALMIAGAQGVESFLDRLLGKGPK